MSEINDLPPLTQTQEVAPSEVELETADVPGEDMSNSPFAKMFRGGATKKELQHFLNNCLYFIAQECKRSERIAKRASRRFLCSITGKRYD